MQVVERCFTCGVEHEVRADECEACGGALRYWCRAHSHQVGWLESPECRGCAEEKARPATRRPPVPSRPKAAPPAASPPSPPLWRKTLAPSSRTVAPSRKRPPPEPRERQALLMMLGAMVLGVILISATGEQNTLEAEMSVKLVILLALLLGAARLFIGRSGR
jgi:hypothetical protein